MVSGEFTESARLSGKKSSIAHYCLRKGSIIGIAVSGAFTVLCLNMQFFFERVKRLSVLV